MGQVRDALKFVDAGLSDKHMPLGHQRNSATGKFELYCKSNSESRWGIVQEWTGANFDMFLLYQSYMLSPFFELEGKKVHFYNLDPHAVLPFIEDKRASRPVQSHHGSVWKVKIHPAHHDGPEDSYFAVKGLHSSDEDGVDFKYEVNAWAKSVGTTGHPHLINLLATWHQNRTYYMLFPWAKGNLRDYWKSCPLPPHGLLAQWMAEQCLGIAEGLKKIHRCGSFDLQANNDWGVHGDIKLENILWFSDEGDNKESLVICDFGFTRFHGKDTRSNAHPVSYSPTYRPPEYDPPGGISRANDVWALGCLYLEFITWYLTGLAGVQDEFPNQRVKEDREKPFPTDKFFQLIHHPKSGDYGITIKPSVLKWIQHLRSQDHCSKYFHDFLDLIEKGLLVIRPTSRMRCDKVVNKLTEIYEKCVAETGESYCYAGCPRPMSEIQNSIR
ncbi:kinase-like domain-containing protein, partial [Xylogone sp. PMI_703]